MNQLSEGDRYTGDTCSSQPLMRSFSLQATSLGISREQFLHHGADLDCCFPLQKISFGFGSMHLSISIGRELRVTASEDKIAHSFCTVLNYRGLVLVKNGGRDNRKHVYEGLNIGLVRSLPRSENSGNECV